MRGDKRVLLVIGLIIVVTSAALVIWYFTGPGRSRGTLIIVGGFGGTTDPSPGTYGYDVGQVVTIIAIPDSGYNFSRWDPTGTSTAPSAENPLDVRIEGGTVTYQANFVAANLLRNPSVEGDENDNGEPDYWYSKEATVPTDQHIWSTDAHTGNRSLEIHITRNDTLSPTAFTAWRQKFDLDYPLNKSGYVPLEKGQSYRLRAWGKTEGAELRIVVVIWHANASHLLSEGTGVNSSTWMQSSWANFTVPQEARFVAIGAVIMQKNIETGFEAAWARADDFELTVAP